MNGWTSRNWSVAGLVAAAVVLLIGLPTDVIPNPVFGRPEPVTWWSVPVLLLSALLTGLLVGTYVVPGGQRATVGAALDDVATTDRRRLGFGGFLAFFAVGCPVCNKLVVLALGTSGALSWFAPLQPVLAVASLALLGWSLRRRLTVAASCPVP